MVLALGGPQDHRTTARLTGLGAPTWATLTMAPRGHRHQADLANRRARHDPPSAFVIVTAALPRGLVLAPVRTLGLVLAFPRPPLTRTPMKERIRGTLCPRRASWRLRACTGIPGRQRSHEHRADTSLGVVPQRLQCSVRAAGPRNESHAAFGPSSFVSWLTHTRHANDDDHDGGGGTLVRRGQPTSPVLGGPDPFPFVEGTERARELGASIRPPGGRDGGYMASDQGVYPSWLLYTGYLIADSEPPLGDNPSVKSCSLPCAEDECSSRNDWAWEASRKTGP